MYIHICVFVCACHDIPGNKKVIRKYNIKKKLKKQSKANVNFKGNVNV